MARAAAPSREDAAGGALGPSAARRQRRRASQAWARWSGDLLVHDLQMAVKFWRGRYEKLAAAPGDPSIADRLAVVAGHLHEKVHDKAAPAAALRRAQKGARLAARSSLVVAPSNKLDVKRHGELDPVENGMVRGMVRGSIGQKVGAHCDARGPEVVLEAEGHREAEASADLPSMPAVPRFPSLGAEAQAGARGAFEGGDCVEHNGEHDGAQDVGQYDEDEVSVDATVAPDPGSHGDVPPPLDTVNFDLWARSEVAVEELPTGPPERRWEVAVANCIRAEDLWMATLETLRPADDDSMMDADMECSEVEAAGKLR
ncbi:unnamed protein product, partial [Prorocentrum cordatum]